jgi:hypothetical protein
VKKIEYAAIAAIISLATFGWKRRQRKKYPWLNVAADEIPVSQGYSPVFLSPCRLHGQQ